MDAYETVMFWLALYPHDIGDEILEEIINES